jgi:hypothetical protein
LNRLNFFGSGSMHHLLKVRKLLQGCFQGNTLPFLRKII